MSETTESSRKCNKEVDISKTSALLLQYLAIVIDERYTQKMMEETLERSLRYIPIS